MKLQLQSMALGNTKSVRDLSLLLMVRLMRWQTEYMLGLLDRSKVVSVGRRVVLLGSSISKTLQHLMGSLIQWQQNWLLKMEKLLRALNYLILELLVSTPVGDTLMINHVLKSCIICIEGRDLLTDLVLLDMHDFDVILGMD